MNWLNMYFLLAIINHDIDIFHTHHVGSLEVLKKKPHITICIIVLLQHTIVDHFSEGNLKLWWHLLLPISSDSVPRAMVVDKMLWPTLYLTKWSTHDCFLVTWGSMKYSEKKTGNIRMTWFAGSLTFFSKQYCFYPTETSNKMPNRQNEATAIRPIDHKWTRTMDHVIT